MSSCVLFCVIFSCWVRVDFVFYLRNAFRTSGDSSGEKKISYFFMLGGPLKPPIFVRELAPHAPHRELLLHASDALRSNRQHHWIRFAKFSKIPSSLLTIVEYKIGHISITTICKTKNRIKTHELKNPFQNFAHVLKHLFFIFDR